jgi:amidase
MDRCRIIPAMDEPLHFKTITELSGLIQSKKLSPVEVTSAQLDRIDRLDGRLKAYATVTADLALEQARTAEAEIGRGRYRGPLHGVPIAVKDLCFTRGVRTMGGSAVLMDHVPSHDSTVVARLADAGSVLLGKLNLTEGAMGGYNPKLKAPENPWRESHWPGASSSGSGAAAAAGLAYGTLGSDTGGSIRNPSAVCGVVGLKPTWGRVSRYGVLALAESLDHVGPITRSCGDAAIMLEAIAGSDPLDPTTLPDPVEDLRAGLGRGVKGMRIGFDEGFTSVDIAADFAAAVTEGVAVMERLGAVIVPVKMPARLRDYVQAWPVICTAEALAAHADYYPKRAAEYGPWFRGWLERGASVTGGDYARANNLRAACVGELRAMIRDVDVFACPSTARAAYPVTPEVLYGPIPADRDPWQSRYTAPFNFAGLPTISVPCGLSEQGLPLSLQFVGKPLAEGLLIQIGDAYERATPWHELHPPGW